MNEAGERSPSRGVIEVVYRASLTEQVLGGIWVGACSESVWDMLQKY